MKLNSFVLAIVITLVQSLFPQEANSPGAEAQWKVVWSDEFNGPAIDKSVWNYEIGLIRNKEPQYYTDRAENSYIENGNLVIETRMENYRGAPYTSASLNTRGRKAFLYGRIEMRARLPKGNAIWPAFWTMGERGRWPRCGEIDIMEMWVGKSRRLGQKRKQRIGGRSHDGLRPLCRRERETCVGWAGQIPASRWSEMCRRLPYLRHRMGCRRDQVVFRRCELHELQNRHGCKKTGIPAAAFHPGQYRHSPNSQAWTDCGHSSAKVLHRLRSDLPKGQVT